MSNIATLEPRPQLSAGARPTAIVPTDMDSCYRLAKAVCMAGMAPKGLDTPEKAMVAIMHGLEIGLTPMAALQRIAVVNGRPTIWGDGAIGLVRGSGLCEWVKERIDGEGDSRAAICEAKRRGEPEAIVRKFSVSDAKKAGLWGKGGPWQQCPGRMLQMRARGFALRDLFADVLGGLYLKEELDDADQAPRREPPVPSAMPTPPVPNVTRLEPPAPPVPPVPAAPPAPPQDMTVSVSPVELYKTALASATDAEAVEAIWNDLIEPQMAGGAIGRNDYEAIEALENEALARFQQ